jgi:peroxidase
MCDFEPREDFMLRLHSFITVAAIVSSLAACSSSPASSDSSSGADLSSDSTAAGCTANDPFKCAPKATPTWVTGLEARTVDGSNNNLSNPTWGAAGTPELRPKTSGYADGVGAPAGANRPSPRAISSAIEAQGTNLAYNANDASDMLWQWGQFMDHDFALSETAAAGTDEFDIPVPKGDPSFDPKSTGTKVIPTTRSLYKMVNGIRSQYSEDTSYIDGSTVYGSDATRANDLRAFDGKGHLLTSAGNYLPYNTFGLNNANNTNLDPTTLFLGGDIRVNEQVALTAMHTTWMREHNRIATELAADFPTFTDEEIYQAARAIVGAEIAHITYDEFLPILLGPNAIPAYKGYNPDTNATMHLLFTTACYRIGHTMLSPQVLMRNSKLQPVLDGSLDLRTMFFVPDQIIHMGGIEPILRGLTLQKAQAVDEMVVDDVRNFLFGPPGSGGLDLISLNIQRGRDHGIGSYNQSRVDFGLPAAKSFSDISSDPAVAAKFASIYASIDDVDAWPGAIAEDHVQGAMVGSLVYTVLVDQYTRLRNGDRFYYENALPQYLVEWVKKQTLAGVIRRNTTIQTEMNDDVFHIPASADAVTN